MRTGVGPALAYFPGILVSSTKDVLLAFAGGRSFGRAQPDTKYERVRMRWQRTENVYLIETNAQSTQARLALLCPATLRFAVLGEH